MDKFIGSWKLLGSENLEDYMQAVGITDEMRAVANAINPNLTISQEGDTVVFNLQTVIGGRKYSFKLGEEFHRKTMDGRDCKVVVSLDGDKLIEVSKWDDTESSTLYEIKDGQLIKSQEVKQKWNGEVVVNVKEDMEVSKWGDPESTTTYEIKDGKLIKTPAHQDAVTVRPFEKA